LGVITGDQRVGTVLNGTYRLERLIGQGAVGNVYRAAHLRLPRNFAVKLLHGKIARPNVFERFRREAQIASALGVGHIVEVVDFNHSEDGDPYLVMELLDGEDLITRIRRAGRLSLKDTARVVDHVTTALKAVHAKDIVHRDLKPENIFLCKKDGQTDFVKVLDFGMSKILTSSMRVTQAGAMVGTPNYMSPEQALGQEDVDRRADIFALGAIVYECLTGRMAFRGNTLPVLIDRICNGAPTPIRELVPDVSEQVERVVSRAIEKRPEDRYPDVVQMRDAFLLACGYQAVADPLITLPGVRLTTEDRASLAPRDPAVESRDARAAAAGTRTMELMKQIFRRPATRAALVVVVLGMAIGAGAAAYLTRAPPPAPQQAAAADARPAAPVDAATPDEAMEAVRIEIRSRPRRARVCRMDSGELLGTTPLELIVPGGSERIGFRLEKRGYRDKVHWITPDTDQSSRIVLRRAR